MVRPQGDLPHQQYLLLSIQLLQSLLGQSASFDTFLNCSEVVLTSHIFWELKEVSAGELVRLAHVLLLEKVRKGYEELSYIMNVRDIISSVIVEVNLVLIMSWQLDNLLGQ